MRRLPTFEIYIRQGPRRIFLIPLRLCRTAAAIICQVVRIQLGGDSGRRCCTTRAHSVALPSRRRLATVYQNDGEILDLLPLADDKR